MTLPACSEYGLNSASSPNAGPGPAPSPSATVDTGFSVPPTCDDFDLSVQTVAVDEDCLAEPIHDPLSARLQWHATGIDAFTAPMVANLDDDDGDGVITLADTPEVVVIDKAGKVHVLDGATGAVEWTWASGQNYPATPAIADLDGDGWPEIVVADDHFTALNGEDGTVQWTSPDTGIGQLVLCSAVSIHDLDGDGSPEVLLGNVILDGQDGSILASGGHGHGSSVPLAALSAAADLDGDGRQELVVGNAAYDETGATLWLNSDKDGSVAIANFDGDDRGEVVVSWSESQYQPAHVRLQDDDGTVLWDTLVGGRGIGSPVIDDLDADGMPEIGVVTAEEYVVLDTDGSILWAVPIDEETSGYTGSSAFDFEGDGAVEIVFADESAVWVFDGTDGTAKLHWTEHYSGTCTEYPIVADVDGDGQAEIVFGTQAGGEAAMGVRVLESDAGTWQPGLAIWNQHAYSITNVDDLGGIPASPTPAWHAQNSFRSGYRTLDGWAGPAPDATVLEGDLCTLECEAGSIWFTVRVGNEGTEALEPGTPLVVEAEQGGAWVEVATIELDEVAPGATTEGVLLELEPGVTDTGRLRLSVGTVDGDCDTDDDVVIVEGIACP